MIPPTNPHTPVSNTPDAGGQVSGVSMPHGVAAAALPTLTNLSAEDLLAYCGAQLNAIDGQIHDLMGSQQRALVERQQIGKAVSYLKTFGDTGPKTQEDMVACYNAVDDAIKALPPGDPARAALSDFKDKMEAKYGSPIGGGNNAIHTPAAGEWAGTTGQLSQIGEDIKGQSELDMINLQGLVTQRQSVVSLTTQMMAKMQESLMSIAKNI